MSVSGKKVLVFTAHPDDETLISGTLAKLSQNGNEVVIVIATDGDKGTHDPEQTPESISRVRHDEMEQAARVLGISVDWLNFRDGGLFHNESELKEAVFRKIRLEEPDIIFTFDPFKKYEVHSDHITIGRVASEAAYLADGCHYYPKHLEQGIKPFKPREAYLFQPEEPNYSVDIHSAFDLKIQSAEKHVSQPGIQSFMHNLKERKNRKGEAGGKLFRESFHKLFNSNLLI